jgi:hypothetical protein
MKTAPSMNPEKVKSYRLFFHLFLMLSLWLPWKGIAQELPEPLTHKTEVKFLIPDLNRFPPSILEAITTGKPHQDIVRRGIVIQQYLAVTKKNIFKIFRELQTAGIPFGSDRQMSDFLFPGKAKEIRLMRKSIKEGGQIKNFYQVTLQGSGGISSDKVETPEILTEFQTQKIKVLFENLQPEVSQVVRKLYFECTAMNKENDPLLAYNHSVRTVEVDMFFTQIDNKIVPFFIDGEIKFREKDRREALSAASDFQRETSQHPLYFGPDVSGQQAMKARNIAVMGLSSSLEALFEKYSVSNEIIFSKIREDFEKWADPEIITLAYKTFKFNHRVLDKKVLMNAEAFGFGPSAAIAEFFPYLHDSVTCLSYIGTGHTLDLQSKLPYNKVFDLDRVEKSKHQEYFNSIAKDYDVFITASDFESALWAKQLGLKVIIYDPLTWYWPNLPQVIQQADFYIAQNFFGVAERLKCECEQVREYVIIPPIVSGILSPEYSDTLLVNMGGLSNPYLDDRDLITFAHVVFDIAHEVLGSQFQDIHFVTNKKIAESMKGDYKVTTMLPSQVQEILSRSSVAIMTSGLGNIYEASTMEKMVLWLPPANDSQGQQIKLLQQHHMTDFAIDWHNLIEGETPIDYFAPQQEVLQRVAVCMKKLSVDMKAQAKLKSAFENLLARPKQKQPALSKLAKTFEVDGAKLAAESIIQWLSSP